MRQRRPLLCALAAALLSVAVPSSGAPPGAGLTAVSASLVNLEGAAKLSITFDAADGPPPAPRVFTLDAPPRIVLDLPQTGWKLDGPLAPDREGLAVRARFGLAAPGLSRIVLDLSGPARVTSASATRSAGGLSLDVALAETSPERFAAEAGWPSGAAPPSVADPSPRAGFIVALDPGHGGLDPGAVRQGVREKDITLAFALDLAPRLREAGIAVALTREDDRFVSLRDRVAFARAAGADLFLSIHADALRAGDASGASVYTLSAQASDAEAAALAARENRVDLLAGAEFAAEGSDVARALIDLVQRDTMASSRRFAELLVLTLAERIPVLDGDPLRAAGFRVLKAPDVPSALVELGFVSSAADRARLIDPAWRAEAADAMADAVVAWAAEQGRIAARP